jgi:hypothetical protein
MHHIQNASQAAQGRVGHVDRAPLDEIYTLVFSFLFSAWANRMGVHQYRYFLQFDYLSKIKAKSVVAFA